MLLKELSNQGFDYERTSRGHYMVYKNGRPVTTLPGTPSDWRSLRNCIADLKKAGYKK